MQTPARLLRNSVTRIDRRWDRLTEREHAQRERIMDLGQALMTIHGRHTMTMTSFALAIGATRAAIRRYFPDLDSLLAHILHRHLRLVARALGDAGRTHPEDQPAQRAAYAAFTRTGFGALTEAHLLLTRDRHLLPADELETLERTRTGLGETIAGDLGRHAMLLLDEPGLEPDVVERMLVALHQATTAPAAQDKPPAPPPDPDVSVQRCARGPVRRPPPGPLTTMDQISCRWPLARAGPLHASDG